MLDNLEAFESKVTPQEFYVEAFDDNVWIRPLSLGEILSLDLRTENSEDITVPLLMYGVVKADGSAVFDASTRAIGVLEKLPGMAAQAIAGEIARISGLAVSHATDAAEKK